MSAAPTFDTEKKKKKNRNEGILRLRLAYGRRSNNTVLTDSKSIANAFNNYFSTIGPNLAANIPNVNMSFYNFLSNSGSPQLNSFILVPRIQQKLNK